LSAIVPQQIDLFAENALVTAIAPTWSTAREVSRFARNSRDWQQLIEMCRVVDTVLIDQETVYAPRHGNDRLLLGLKGSLNEYELDHAKPEQTAVGAPQRLPLETQATLTSLMTRLILDHADKRGLHRWGTVM
jgi:Resolvase, N terminal domain